MAQKRSIVVCSSTHPPPCIVIAHTPSDDPLTSVITVQGTRDTKQEMQTQGHMSHKMSQKLPIASVYHFFWQEFLTLKSCTCSTGATGATGMGSPAAGWAAGLAATWAAGLAALLEGVVTRCAHGAAPF